MRTRAFKWLSFFLVVLTSRAVAEEALSATEIVRRSDDLLRGERSYATMTMTITRPRWTRALSMEAWTEGTERVFVRILSPKKEKGVTFLKKGREAWQYVPAIDRVIKLPPSMMLQSWMGSDFTNDDVVRADSLISDYTHTILEEVILDGEACWVIESVPHPDAAVVWSRIVLTIRQNGCVPLRAEYYDEYGEVVKYYETADIRTVEGRTLAATFTMHDALEPGHSTTMSYDALTFEPEMKESLFTESNLRR